MLDEILRPLLSADGGDIEVIAFDGARDVALRLTGAFRGDPGTPYVRDHVVRPALERALGAPLQIRWEP